MITAELFSQGPRPAAMSIAVLINWCANFLVGIGFLTMQTTLENYTFLPFSVFLAVFWIFTYKKVPGMYTNYACIKMLTRESESTILKQHLKFKKVKKSFN